MEKPVSALKWNLMLLAGRPLAVVGLLLIGHGLLFQTATPIPTGILLIAIGFVVGWAGKIGKTLFSR